MKIKDFDFRLVLTPAQLAVLQCDNKDCPCQSPLAYGNEAKCMLGECIDTEAEVELWSGAVDRKGEKIYCGDIIRNHDYKIDFLIKDREFGGMMIMPLNGSDLDMACALSNCEVIGNIHENPELLRGQDEQSNNNRR